MSETSQPNRLRLASGGLAIAAFAAISAVAFTVPGRAQPTPAPTAPPAATAPAAAATPAAVTQTGGELWAVGSCANCHGNLAAGDGDPAYPAGPNLRSARITPEDLLETIACGRPGSEMPYNLATAYTEYACYGIPVPTDPATLGANRGAGFSEEQIHVLVDFLVQNVIGQRRITRENCALFFGGNPNSPACLAY